MSAQLKPSLCSRVYGIERRGHRTPWPVDVRAYIIIRLRGKISRKKISRFGLLQTAKKCEIDSRNLEFSEVFPDKQSGGLRFLRNVNLHILKSI
jgi:hypothetical protein